jgi:hypothetical protein
MPGWQAAGQGWMMAFQAGAPHALERGLEAVAYAYREQRFVLHEATWEKPQCKNPPLVLKKHFEIVGRGVGVVVGCGTFPTWNTYPGLFAALATGNAVIVKPHENAILPAAITVRTIRAVLAENGIDADLVTLCVPAERETTQKLVTPRRSSRSISLAATSSASGCSTTAARHRSMPSWPASTTSSSIRPTPTSACWATSPSRWRCIRARCARPRPRHHRLPGQAGSRSCRARRHPVRRYAPAH